MGKRFVSLVLITVLLFVLVPETLAASPDSRPIVIQGAMDVEVMDMVESLQNVREITYGGWTFWKGTLDDYPVIISRTEVGVTNAAASTTIAIEKFNPRLIINQGTAGGHDPELHQYDIILGEKSINFGSFRSQFADVGQGVNPEKWEPSDLSLRIDGEKKSYNGFIGDPEVLEIAKELASTYSHGKVVT